jgi:NADH-quinone oxidoreductase subunit C
MRSLSQLLATIQQVWPSVSGVILPMQELTVEVPADQWHDFALSMRDQFGFEQLIDLCGVDYISYGQVNWETDAAANLGFSRGVFDFEVSAQGVNGGHSAQRFAVVTHLLSVEHNQRLRVRVYCPDDAFPVLDSVCDVWASVNWFEREAFDLYGIAFNNHPDLRRILTDYGFVGHPLRKDFPLQGHVEMRFDPAQNRVIYEPVNLENRVNTPRVIRYSERLEAN